MICILGLLVASVAQANQSHCQNGVGERRATTPFSMFEPLENGTVIHNGNGLQWSQCALGQSWNGRGCDGAALALTWEEAQRAIEQLNSENRLAGHNDWRLPSLTELESLIEKCRAAPAINERAFPNTPWAGFWTSSVDTSEEDHAWFVGFYHGLSYEYSRAASYRVRPVRDR